MGITRKSASGGGSGGALQAVRVRYDVEVQGGANGSTINLHTFAAGTFVHSAYMVTVEAFTDGPGDPAGVSLGLQTTSDFVSSTRVNQSPWADAYRVLLLSGYYLTANKDLTITVDEINDTGLVSGKYDVIIFYFTPSSI